MSALWQVRLYEHGRRVASWTYGSRHTAAMTYERLLDERQPGQTVTIGRGV